MLKHEQHSAIPKPSGLSSKEKKLIRRKELTERRAILMERMRTQCGGVRVSRRIPNNIAEAVMCRDSGRDFGRPEHVCANGPAPIHHIKHFRLYLNRTLGGDPHTINNLEAPCGPCHKLAHEMGIPSGTSIEDFFRERFNNPKIEA